MMSEFVALTRKNMFFISFLASFMWIIPANGAVNNENLLFYLSFENEGCLAAYSQGDGNPIIEGEIQKVPGRNGGNAMLFRKKGDLIRFNLEGNLNLAQGAISLWVKELDTNANQYIWNPYFQIFAEDKVFNVLRLWQPLNVAGGIWQNGKKTGLTLGPVGKENEWNHILFTWRKHEICTYINGVMSDKLSNVLFVLKSPEETFSLGRPLKSYVHADGYHTGRHLLVDAPQRAEELKIGKEAYGAYVLDDFAIFNRYMGAEDARGIFEHADGTPDVNQIGTAVVTVENYISIKKIKVNADFGRFIPADVRVYAKVFESNSSASILSSEIPHGLGGLEYGYIKTGSLKVGEYSLQVFAELNGEMIAKTPKVNFTIPKKQIWEDNTYGSEDVVLPGFKPLSADKNTASMWGRQYTFGQSLMPEQINNQGVDMLVRPISWNVKIGNKIHTLITKSSKLVSSSPTKAIYETDGILGELKVSGHVLVEYDGFMKFDLEFSPGDKPVFIDKLYMDIPFKTDCATNLYYPQRRSGKWESDWSSELSIAGTTTTNVVTIGSPDICVQWLTESDQYYSPRGNKNALKAFELNGARVFRINVIDSKKKIHSPMKLTFALQAGPIKARPANWRGWTMSKRRAELNTKLYNNVAYRYDWWARAPGELIPRHDFTENRDPNLHKDEIQMTSMHFAGFRSYEETNPVKRTPEWQLYESEWIRLPRGTDEGASTPGWVNTYVDTNSSWGQWHIYNAYKLFSTTGMRGLYYDDWRNAPSMNEAAGSGYIDEEGVRRPIQPIYSQRELHRRIYAIVRKFRPDDGIIIMHVASQTYLPVISFADIIYDGEIMMWSDLIPPEGDYFKTHRNDLYQAMFQCKQYGPVPGFHDMTMNYMRHHADIVGPNLLFMPTQRMLWAILLTHDIHMHAGFVSGAEEMVSLWMDSFGIADPQVKFHAYWDVNPAAKIVDRYWHDGNKENVSNIWASCYSKSDKVLIVVARDAPNNYGFGSLITVEIQLDREKLGLPDGPLRCTSLESLGRHSFGTITGDILKVDVPANDFAGIIIQPE